MSPVQIEYCCGHKEVILFKDETIAKIATAMAEIVPCKKCSK